MKLTKPNTTNNNKEFEFWDRNDIEVEFWERFNNAFPKSDSSYAELVESFRRQATDYFNLLRKCLIYGSEIDFKKFVPEQDIEKVCQDIWDNPDKYSDFKVNSDSAYYKFLKFLWVKFPDGTEKQLVKVVKEPF